MYDENIKVFVSIQNDIKRFLNGYSLFDQTIFEDAFVRIGLGKDNQDEMIEAFYWELFELNLIYLFVLQPYWYESDGTKKEVKKILTLEDPKFFVLDNTYSYLSEDLKGFKFKNFDRFEGIMIDLINSLLEED